MRCPACHQSLSCPDNSLSHTQGSLCGPPGFPGSPPKASQSEAFLPNLTKPHQTSPPGRLGLQNHSGFQALSVLFLSREKGVGGWGRRKEARFPLQGRQGLHKGSADCTAGFLPWSGVFRSGGTTQLGSDALADRQAEGSASGPCAYCRARLEAAEPKLLCHCDAAAVAWVTG